MKVFVSFAYEDVQRAREVAALLEVSAISAYFAADQVELGESFVSYMETALDVADYCLLLWSRCSSQKEWVKLEWQAALVRSVQEKQAFLLVARLDDTPLPRLLAPRLAVDLHPELEPGVSRLLALLTRDRAASQSSGSIVARAKVTLEELADATEIYLASALFGMTLPVRVVLDKPAGLLLENVRRELSLPSGWNYDNRVGEHFEYRLFKGSQVIPSEASLAAAGVGAGDVLTLQVERRPFAAVDAHEGAMTKAVFRGGAQLDVSKARRKALAVLAESLRKQGFAPNLAAASMPGEEA